MSNKQAELRGCRENVKRLKERIAGLERECAELKKDRNNALQFTENLGAWRWKWENVFPQHADMWSEFDAIASQPSQERTTTNQHES